MEKTSTLNKIKILKLGFITTLLLLMASVVFAQNSVTINLWNHDQSTGLSGGVAQYDNGHGWQTIGTTDASGSVTVTATIPAGTYPCRMLYLGATKNGSSLVVPSSGSVSQDFQTTLVTLNLYDHGGSNLLSGGTAQYYNGGQQTIGTTVSSGTNPQIELLSATSFYTFYMVYHGRQQSLTNQTVNSGGTWTQNVNFQTTLTRMNLKKCDGSFLSGGTAQYYNSGQTTFGTTTTTQSTNPQIELLPLSGYTLYMIYNNATVSNNAVTVPSGGGIYDYDVTTTNVTFVNPDNHTISYSYNSGSYHTFTPNSMDLLSGSYAFKINGASTGITKSVSGCSQSYSIAPCTLAIDTTKKAVCTGHDTLIAPSGSNSYSWSPGGATTQSIIATSSGTYAVTVAYDFTCAGAVDGSHSISTNVTIVGSSLSVVASQTHAISCHNGSDGALSVSVTGGTGSLSYSWSPSGGSNSTASGLSSGTYSVTVSDNYGCSGTSNTVTLSNPDAIVATASLNHAISCHSGQGTNNDGAVTVNATGGTGTLTYSWSPSGGTNATASGLSAGSYSVTVTDGNTCTQTSNSVTLSEPTAISGTATIANNISCHSGQGTNNDGSVTISATGGTGTLSYNWSPSGGTNASASGLSANSYSVAVSDGNNCSYTSSVSLSEPTAISATASISHAISCHSGQGTNNDGSVTISATGGTGTLSYNWSPSGGNSATASGLSAGSYSVTVTDGNSCFMTSNSVTLSEPQAISATITGNSTVMGTVTNTYTGPAGMATYSWSVKGAGASIVGSSSGSSVNITTLCNSTADTIMLTVTNSNGCSTSTSKTVTVSQSSTITVYSTLYETGTGNHPSISKVPLAADLKVFNRHTCGRRDNSQNHYAQVWNSTTGLVTTAVVTGPSVVSIGGGTSYRYIITVPAGGHYLVIGKSQVSSSRCSGGLCTIYTGSKSGPHDDIDGDDDRDDEENNSACSNATMKFHTIIKDNNGKCSEGTTQQQHGSLMLMVSPATIVFDDSVELLPVVYESVEGDWDVTVSAEPPAGFYTSDTALSTSVTDSAIHAVQFTITDTGSEWTYTKLTHTIQHKGATRTAYSLPAMINERETPTAIIVSPNPADNQIQIQLPKFEGKATIYIYNLMGQKVAEKNISISRGASVTMDISRLVSGTYLVTAKNSNGKASSHLIITGRQ